MVLQIGEEIIVTGTSSATSVQVALHKSEKVITTTTVSVQNKRFVATLNAIREYGGPYSLVATEQPSGATVKINNVMIGEVYLCSGQSNMEWPTRATWESQREIEDSDNYPNLRFFTVNRANSTVPLEDITARGWFVSRRNVTGEFSAICYFFGRALQKRLGVPIGLVASSWGGTPIEHWISAEGFRSCPNVNPSKILYNAMIHPLRHLRFKGALWYQGESNAGRPQDYACLLPAMIKDWRNTFKTKLHFLNVQLAGWVPGDFRLLRWVQWTTRNNLENYGLATAVDLGEEQDIHPRKKKEVGERLEFIAAHQVYGRPTAYYPPLFGKTTLTRNGEQILMFNVSLTNYANEGLVLKPTAFCSTCCNDYKKVFQVFDKEGTEYPTVEYALRENHILVTAVVPARNQPQIQLRYAWHNFPQCMIYSKKTDLPMYPNFEIFA